MTLLRNAIGWLGGHVRLAIEYALIALLVSVSGFALWQWGHSQQQDKERAELASKVAAANGIIGSLVQDNHAQDQAIAALRELRAKDAKAITGLQRDNAHADRRSLSFKMKLDQLERNNARAKTLLDTAVPPDTGCVLDGRTCPGSEPPHASSSRATH